MQGRQGMERNPTRVAWVDYAKGICIVLVVMMHSTLGAEAAAGETSWMGAFVAFASPFRIPAFFLISGLFLFRVIDRDWRTYLDRKVLHFAYFYVLWVAIQFVFKAPGLAAEIGWAGVAHSYVLSFVDPFGVLWFIYLLPVFFVVTKLTHEAPRIAVWLAAASLQVADVHTGWLVVDEFCARFVYFYSGYALAPYVLSFAEYALANRLASGAFLGAWAVFEAVMVFGGYADLPLAGLGLGLLGALAIVTASALLSTHDFARPLRYAGGNSIVIYLAFFLPMAATRVALLKFAPGLDLGIVALIITAAGVLTPLALHRLVNGTVLSVLFERPSWARLPAKTMRSASAAA